MAELLRSGAKVKYFYNGKWQKGVIHAIKTHEEPSGIVTKLTYLIDTGRENPDHRGRPDRQPEQIELNQELVKV